MADRELIDLSEVTCPICLDVYVHPVSTSCGHEFCKSCMNRAAEQRNRRCPLCRSPIFGIKRRGDKIEKIESIASTHYAVCDYCGEVILLSRLRHHAEKCQRTINNGKKKRSTLKKIVKCGRCEKNVSGKGLLKRLRKEKRGAKSFICLECWTKNLSGI
ncbi:E3 ubiquitin-protein ligase RNF114-like [Centruroides sculpturatus]|uniref:E3 ubiquitin-protein ligase RNF114-like n=1 Tax=Centruroides sculpturatus TaxID=218467 RepID=UPI000C6D24B8|nr:E3 ubiquitin-protein ligase RNF114-like [Centruroides sculpturatus]